MEIMRSYFAQTSCTSARQVLQDALREMPELAQLEAITEILTQSAVLDENVSELIDAAWSYLCENDLWSFKYESMDQYRQLINYREMVKPIIQRFRRSDRAKFASVSLIERNWGVSLKNSLPQEFRPRAWSKHMLCLLSQLSTHCSHEDALRRLRKSMEERPRRSRHTSTLIASDVQRVLDRMRVRTKRKGKHRPLAASPASDASLQPSLVTQDVKLELYTWSQMVSWSSTCVHHLRYLASLEIGEAAHVSTREECVLHLEIALFNNCSLRIDETLGQALPYLALEG
ncbi:hypothetical protein BO99DRAFT_321964 [Aspergillus violaceofuscus CBS 115571]|uniref:Uncharacterized protein n=1 Tax=Aspergillus violaceofuscus (strain CBS 115571) TaxID=1450538 RepID=A0A2V5IJV9_ASPV1|nr:hypothetical protein BO99DRAFT_321964 [Aspergillus violaceofuscus CBS 115571]